MPVYPLDDAGPWAVSDSVQIQWSKGWGAYTLASSRCVRVNKRGIHTKPAFWTPVHDLHASGWHTWRCTPGLRGLCAMGNETVFPEYPLRPVYDPHTPPVGLGAGWAGCARESDGRVLDATAAGYDLSPCDVIDGGWDVVLTDHTLALMHTDMDAWMYWTLCILVICVVRSLSYLVALRMHPEGGLKALVGPSMPAFETRMEMLFGAWARTTSPRTTAACLVIWALCVFPTLHTIYVTVEEQIFFAAVAVYIPVYSLLWSMSTHTEDPPLFNMIVASVLLATTRLYAGTETPYVPVLACALGARALMKLRNDYWSRLVAVTVMLDGFLLSLMSVLGFVHDPPYQVLVGALALLASDVLEIS